MSIHLHEIGGPRPSVRGVTEHPRVFGLGLVGIEVELEGLPVAPPFKYWEEHQDGSLRDYGREFVLREPLGGTDLYNAIKELSSGLAKYNPTSGWRTSTHIHLDVRDLTVRELRGLLLLYSGYESVLFQLQGTHRMNSIFCPAVTVSQQQIKTLSALINCEEGLFFNQRFGDKYASINVLSIPQRGSIEFRGSEAKWKQVQLLRLVNRILTLRNLAIDTANCSYEEIISLVKESKLSEIFGASLSRPEGELAFDREASEEIMRDVLYLESLKDTPMSKVDVSATREVPQLRDPPVDVVNAHPEWVEEGRPNHPLRFNAVWAEMVQAAEAREAARRLDRDNEALRQREP